MSSKIEVSRELAEKVDDVLYIMTGEDSYQRLVQKYGTGWWGALTEMRAELRSVIAAPIVEPALREHCKQCAKVVKTWPESKRDCLGKIEPVVERQPVAAYIRQSDLDRLAQKHVAGCAASLNKEPATGFVEIYTAQPELAELQATIDRLESKLSSAINLDFEQREEIERLKSESFESLYNDAVDEIERLTSEPILKSLSRRLSEAQMTICDQRSEIERLKGGQGEPVAWANDQQLLLCSKSPREDQPNNPLMHNLPRNIAGSALKTDYCNTPLFASQPAPVSVPDGWKLVPIEPTAEMIDAAINTPVADTGDDEVDQPNDYRNMWSAMLDAACLDKVKELNQ